MVDKFKDIQAEGEPCPNCNPTGVFNYGDERCELCHGKAYLPHRAIELSNMMREG